MTENRGNLGCKVLYPANLLDLIASSSEPNQKLDKSSSHLAAICFCSLPSVSRRSMTTWPRRSVGTRSAARPILRSRASISVSSAGNHGHRTRLRGASSRHGHREGTWRQQPMQSLHRSPSTSRAAPGRSDTRTVRSLALTSVAIPREAIPACTGKLSCRSLFRRCMATSRTALSHSVEPRPLLARRTSASSSAPTSPSTLRIWVRSTCAKL